MSSAAATNTNGSSKAKTMMEKISGKAKSASAMDVENEVSQLRTELTELAATIANYGKAEGENIKMQGLAVGEELLARSKETINSLSTQLASLEKEFAVQVKQKPVQALGLAVIFGFVIAALIRR